MTANVEISNNVIAEGKEFLVVIIGTQITNFNFSQNFMVDAKKANGVERVSCF